MGSDTTYFYWCLPIDGALDAQLTSIDIKIGKLNNPTDNVNLELWEVEESGQPIALVENGQATAIAGTSIPEWLWDNSKVTFTWPDRPVVTSDKYYGVILHRSGSANGTHYYMLGIGSASVFANWYSDDGESYSPVLEIHGVYDIWGIS